MPMSGIKVVESCSNIAGPVTGTIFGDLGAEVIKIEKPNGGDDARGWSPPVLHGMGARFKAINRNKPSVVLDLKNSGDVGSSKGSPSRRTWPSSVREAGRWPVLPGAFLGCRAASPPSQ